MGLSDWLVKKAILICPTPTSHQWPCCKHWRIQDLAQDGKHSLHGRSLTVCCPPAGLDKAHQSLWRKAFLQVPQVWAQPTPEQRPHALQHCDHVCLAGGVAKLTQMLMEWLSA